MVRTAFMVLMVLGFNRSCSDDSIDSRFMLQE